MKMTKEINYSIIIAALIVFAMLWPIWDTEKYHTERSFPATQGGTVALDLASQDIEVAVAESDQVHIVFDLAAGGSNAKATLDRYKPAFICQNGLITVRSKCNHPAIFPWAHLSGKVFVSLPKGINLDLHTASGDCVIRGDVGAAHVQCDLSSGDLEVFGAMQQIKVHDSSGDVKIEAERSIAAVDLDCSSGDIRLRGPMADVKLHDSSGDVKIADLTGSLKADLSSGDLTAQWRTLAAGSQIDLRSSSGNIRLRLPADAKLSGSASTSSGEVHTDFPGVVDHSNRVSFEDQDGYAISATVSSGDVWLEKE